MVSTFNIIIEFNKLNFLDMWEDPMTKRVLVTELQRICFCFVWFFFKVLVSFFLSVTFKRIFLKSVTHWPHWISFALPTVSKYYDIVLFLFFFVFNIIHTWCLEVNYVFQGQNFYSYLMCFPRKDTVGPMGIVNLVD